MFNIMVVEDDTDLRKMMESVLRHNGYRPLLAEDGEEALAILESEQADLIISDVMMPNMDGFELTELLRQSNYNMPILLVTVKDSYADKQRGFLAGVDDYMVKPIDINEMILRVRALLRRAQIANEHRLQVGDTLLDFDALLVRSPAGEMTLPQKEFYLLFKLLSYPGKIFTRQQLLDEIWGMDSTTDERTVDVHINRLRDRFKESHDFEIVTVRGLGYKAVQK
ncbi:MAG TPA: response regulator transcription factor [Candidatus Avidehalobacter gallistercoris]|uniref:Heme response regulator HssR n=1 Tax=Candidatus Avidehalobacter gallistercoris TaxID=2840694 RepID=A0A9D1HKX8_9FIRM|nr:response regulator transcription factor [Candidatus Avidehalobacter gallistercoris]